MSGLDIWPGMVDAGSTIGLFEIGSLAETQDHADAAQYQPELRSSTALHPDSEHIPVTRANGILTSFIEPSGGVISGQGCLIDLNGWVPREMVIADAVALNVQHPHLCVALARIASARAWARTRTARAQAAKGPAVPMRPPRRAKQRLEKIKELFRRAIAYDTVVKKAHERGEAPPAPDLRLEALLPYARGEKPVILHADQPVEILDALDLARELKLKAVISGGAEAWKVADAIKKAGVPVLIAGTLNLPRHPYDPYDSAYTNPAKLHAAGVTARDPFPVRWLRRRRNRRAEPSLRSGDGRRLWPAGRRCAQGHHDHAGTDSGGCRPGRLARDRQTGQHRRDRGSPDPADDAGARPVHRRRAGAARKPPHPALCEISPQAGRGSGRPRTAGNRRGADQTLRQRAHALPAKTQAERH